MSDKEKQVNVGKDSVVIGNVSGNVGDGSVVIGPTDNRGNTVLNQPMAVGRNAQAGPGSIAIGAGAGAGSDIAMLFHELGKVIESVNDPSLAQTFVDLCSELNKQQKDKTKISRLWGTIEKSAALGGFVNLITQAAAFIGSII